MDNNQPSLVARLIKTFQVNKQQLSFGSYAAELSFYIIWAIIPIMLALSNVIAILPISEAEIIRTMESALPNEVGSVLIPLLETYLTGTSSSIFSIGLVISLWPASNVFNTLQRVLNTVYKAEPRKNFFLTRGFAYIFTLAIVFAVAIFSFALIFGELIIDFIREVLQLRLVGLDLLLQQGWIIGILGMFLILLIIYQYVPNVDWPLKYSVPGAIFTTIGFILVSQLFTVYLAFSGNSASNSTIGVVIVVVIWLYFNAMVIALGAYANVFYHDFKEKSYWKLVEETTQYQSFTSHSENFRPQSGLMPGLREKIYLVSDSNESLYTQEEERIKE